MTHELFFDQENEIIVLKLNNNFLYNEVEPILATIGEMLAGIHYRQGLVLMSENSNIENRETREAISNGMARLEVSEVAFVGLNAATRMIAKVLLKTGMAKINGNFFKSKEEAINWLKSKRS
jgi:hypothetical protein